MMKQCDICKSILVDGDEPFLFCPTCGHHTFTPIPDDLPWDDDYQDDTDYHELTESFL